VNNNASLTVGALNVQGTSATGLNSSGNVQIINTAPIAVASGSTISSSAGDVVLSTTQFTDLAGATGLSAGAGKTWQVWSTNANPYSTGSGDTVTGLANDFVQYNAVRGSAVLQGTGNGLMYSMAPVVSPTLTGTVTKVYDANNAATLSTANFVLTGIGQVNNDQLTVSNFSNGLYTSVGISPIVDGPATKVKQANDAGTNKTVAVSGLVLTAANNGKPVYGYTVQLNAGTTLTGDVGVIEKAPLGIYVEGSDTGKNIIKVSKFNLVLNGNTVTNALVAGQTLTPITVDLKAKEISQNSSNFVQRLLTYAGTADPDNYEFTQKASATLSNLQNAVKIIPLPSLVVLPPQLPAAPTPSAPAPAAVTAPAAAAPSAAAPTTAAPATTASRWCLEWR